jgi:AcrR family transcriptional regulator
MAKPKPRAKAKPTGNSEQRVCEAALHLIARQGWERLNLEDAARAAKLPAAEMRKLFPDKYALLPGIVRLVDSRMLESFGAADRRASPHDRLFEMFMARFDVLQAHRRAFIDIMHAAKRDWRLTRHMLPAQIKTMRIILGHTGLQPEPPHEPFVLAGLLGIYGLALCAWRHDEAEDMAKTMAALDRLLRRTASIADILFRRSTRL